MTPQEKAEELVDKYFNASFNCKECNEVPFVPAKFTVAERFPDESPWFK